MSALPVYGVYPLSGEARDGGGRGCGSAVADAEELRSLSSGSSGYASVTMVPDGSGLPSLPGIGHSFRFPGGGGGGGADLPDTEQSHHPAPAAEELDTQWAPLLASSHQHSFLPDFQSY